MVGRWLWCFETEGLLDGKPSIWLPSPSFQTSWQWPGLIWDVQEEERLTKRERQEAQETGGEMEA